MWVNRTSQSEKKCDQNIAAETLNLTVLLEDSPRFSQKRMEYCVKSKCKGTICSSRAHVATFLRHKVVNLAHFWTAEDLADTPFYSTNLPVYHWNIPGVQDSESFTVFCCPRPNMLEMNSKHNEHIFATKYSKTSEVKHQMRRLCIVLENIPFTSSSIPTFGESGLSYRQQHKTSCQTQAGHTQAKRSYICTPSLLILDCTWEEIAVAKFIPGEIKINKLFVVQLFPPFSVKLQVTHSRAH